MSLPTSEQILSGQMTLEQAVALDRHLRAIAEQQAPNTAAPAPLAIPSPAAGHQLVAQPRVSSVHYPIASGLGASSGALVAPALHTGPVGSLPVRWAPEPLPPPTAVEKMEEIYHEYLGHQRGLVRLWTWLDQWERVRGWDWAGSKGVLSPDARAKDVSAAFLLSGAVSGRFLLGVPKPHPGIRGDQLFLGLPDAELSWVSRLLWRQAVWDDVAGILWLVTRGVKSPDTDWPDLPSVAIGIRIDPPEKLEFWTKIPSHKWTRPRLEARMVSWNDHRAVRVGRSPLPFGWDVARGPLDSNWPAADRILKSSLHDVSVRRARDRSVLVNPGFSGEVPTVPSDFADIASSFQRADYSYVTDEARDQEGLMASHPELFDQFLNTPGSRAPITVRRDPPGHSPDHEAGRGASRREDTSSGPSTRSPSGRDQPRRDRDKRGR